jgi:hypothetical protein
MKFFMDMMPFGDIDAITFNPRDADILKWLRSVL